MIMARNEDGTYSQVGFVKDNAGIDTEYIYDKDGDIVFEKGFTRETSGTVPLTINGIEKDLKDWSITGNTVQNGTPTPENPVEVLGCGERTGNLLKLNDGNYTVFGVNLTISNGNMVFNGEAIGSGGRTVQLSPYFVLKAGTYTIKPSKSGVCQPVINSRGDNKAYVGTFTITEDTAVYFGINVYDKIYDGEKINVMLNSGSTPLPYEPYGYKIPVVTRGKNLFDYNAEYTDNIQTKAYTISNLDINKYYTCSTSFEKIPGVALASLYFAGGNSLTNGVWKNTPKTFKPDANGQITVYVRYATSSGAPAIFNKVISGEITVMVEEGTTATPYEPYHEPITTPIYLPTPLYSGEVMRSDGSREVKFHKLVLTGSEDWSLQSINSYGIANFYIKVDPTFKPGIKHFCTHFSIQTTLIAQTTKEGLLFTNNDTIYIRVKQELANTVSSFKSWLTEQYAAGTPVTIWYTLETPTTETFTAPQIPTLNGTTVIDVDTAVKPTEMYIKYKSSK